MMMITKIPHSLLTIARTILNTRCDHFDVAVYFYTFTYIHIFFFYRYLLKLVP